MQPSISTPKRRLRRYRDVVGNIRCQQSRKHLTLRETDNQPDAATDLGYYLTALPKDASQNEKRRLLEELANTIGNFDSSDVFVISLWIGYKNASRTLNQPYACYPQPKSKSRNTLIVSSEEELRISTL